LVVINPDDKSFYRFDNGKMLPLNLLNIPIQTATELTTWFEKTDENLPVILINKAS
jgi:hypothetical protein